MKFMHGYLVGLFIGIQIGKDNANKYRYKPSTNDTDKKT